MTGTDRLNDMAFARHLGMRFEHLGDGTSRVSLAPGPQHANTQNRLHGGVVPCLVDAAATTAVMSSFGPGAVLVTADLRVNYIAAGELDGRITATGVTTHTTRSGGFASVVVRAGDGEVIALGQATLILRKPPVPPVGG